LRPTSDKEAMMADSSAALEDAPFGPFLTLQATHWAELARTRRLELDEATLDSIRALGDPIDLATVRQIYLPLTELINLYIDHTTSLYRHSNWFLGLSERPTPFIIGLAGSVAVGKSTAARLLAELLGRDYPRRRIDLVTTDGFLLPNAELERLGLMQRKGFPESYDRGALIRFLTAIKSGLPEAAAPVYSHLFYDIIPGKKNTVRQPDILIVEGLNVLQPARLSRPDSQALAVSDFFDFSIYIDADPADIREWYIQRFASLRATAFSDPRSYFRRYADLSDAEARAVAGSLWDTINAPNLLANIAPTRSRATLVLRKGPNHRVRSVTLRKI
jgi:type I pantothenate kinase